MAEIVLSEPSPELQDIWKLLWHIDVKKDHEADYDSKIVNKLLAETTIKTEIQDYGGRPVNIKVDQEATLPEPQNRHDKDWIMNYVLRREDGKLLYPDVFSDPIFINKDAPVSITSYPLGLKYEVITVTTDADDNYVNTISEFFQGEGEPRMYTSYDTGAHVENILKNAKMANIFDCYSRASQSDPAGKPSLEKLGDKVYIEQDQPLAITYPRYDDAKTFPLSHFYSKYTVNLLQVPDEKLRKEGRLSVSMTYIKYPGGESIKVEEGANTAGAARKEKMLQKKGFKYTKVKNDKTNEKEMIFISKLHGDVAQGLDQHRVIAVDRGWPRKDPATTEGSRFCFISIDQNALTKYFTTGGTYAMFYKLEKVGDNKIALIRPRTMEPAAEFKYLKERALEFVEKINADLTKYNANIPQLNQRRADLPAIVNRLFEQRIEGTASEKYTNIIKNGAKIAAILSFVPKDVLTMINVDGLADAISALKAYTLPAGAGGLVAAKAEFNRVRNLFSEKEKLFNFPIGHIDTYPFTGDGDAKTILPTGIETDLLVKISNGAITKKTVDRLWKSINVEFNPKGRSIRAVFCRVGAKHTTYWCLDVLRQTYDILKKYNPIMADLYIYSLEQQIIGVDTRVDTWLDALNIAGVPRVQAKVAVGGGGNAPNNMLAKTLKNRNNRRGNRSRYNNNTTRRLSKNLAVSNEEEPSEPNVNFNVAEEPNDDGDHMVDVIDSEVNDIDATIDFYTAMQTVGEDPEKIQALHLDFFKRIYDDLTGEPNVQEGGAREEYNKDDKDVEEVDMLEDDDGTDVKFFMTVPTILTYKATLDTLKELLKKVQSLRAHEARTRRIAELTEKITDIEAKITAFETRESLPEMSAAEYEGHLVAEEAENDLRLQAKINADAPIANTRPEINTIKKIIQYMTTQLRDGKPIDEEDELIRTILPQRGILPKDTSLTLVKQVKEYIRTLITKRGDVETAKTELAKIFKLADPEYLTEFGFDLPGGGAGGAAGRGGSRKRRYNNKKTLKAKGRKARKSQKMRRRTV